MAEQQRQAQGIGRASTGIGVSTIGARRRAARALDRLVVVDLAATRLGP